MAYPTTRTELKTYVRRRLGEPVITVNVADEQIEERIDDALALWQEYHYDGTQRIYMKHQVTPSTMTVSGMTGTFSNNEWVRGSTSNTVAQVYQQANTTTLETRFVTQNDTNAGFTAGETLVGQNSGATATYDSLVLGDIDKQYLPVANSIIGITKVLPLGGFGPLGGSGMFSFQYQYLMNDMAMLSGGSVISYYMTRSHMQMLQDLFVGTIDIRFNRHTNRLYLDIDWYVDVKPGQYIIVEAYEGLSPDEFARVWSDRFLRDYLTALVKKQWGQNLVKYNGVAMPGGITMNGQAIYDEGNREVAELETKLRERYEIPPGFFMM